MYIYLACALQMYIYRLAKRRDEEQVIYYYTSINESIQPEINETKEININMEPKQKKIKINFNITTNNWEIKNIQCDNINCSLSLKIIKNNDKFCMCAYCNNYFLYNQFKKWIKFTNFNHIICPCCRKSWINDKIYIKN